DVETDEAFECAEMRGVPALRQVVAVRIVLGKGLGGVLECSCLMIEQIGTAGTDLRSGNADRRSEGSEDARIPRRAGTGQRAGTGASRPQGRNRNRCGCRYRL